MQPTHAEVARTLASGRLPGAAHVHRYRASHPVRHATLEDGTPLLLTRAGGELDTALRAVPAGEPTRLILSVDDLPPAPGAPGHGRLWLSGRGRRLDGARARLAALGYARVNPVGDLLDVGSGDVGTGHVLYRMDVDEARLACGASLVEVDLDEFRAARPDPLHADERELLADLNGHHREQLARLAARVVRGAGGDCRALRIDRYGLLLELSTADGPARRVRIGFARPVRDVPDLAALLHPVLSTRHSVHRV